MPDCWVWLIDLQTAPASPAPTRQAPCRGTAAHLCSTPHLATPRAPTAIQATRPPRVPSATTQSPTTARRLVSTEMQPCMAALQPAVHEAGTAMPASQLSDRQDKCLQCVVVNALPPCAGSLSTGMCMFHMCMFHSILCTCHSFSACCPAVVPQPAPTSPLSMQQTRCRAGPAALPCPTTAIARQRAPRASLDL